MKRLVIASTHKGAGKTSIITGIARAAGKTFGYLKPFGDRMLYRKKRLWDYDSSLITSIFKIDEEPESLSIGFDHAKLSFMYDQASVTQRLRDMAEKVSRGKDLLFLEAGSELSFGASAHLDAISLARQIEGTLILVVNGDEYTVLDDLSFMYKYLEKQGVPFPGVIVNKIKDIENFRETHMEKITGMSINILGILPYEQGLTYMQVSFLADRLFAKVLAGENSLDRVIKNILVGSMSVSSVVNSPVFKRENKLIITAGDRTDLILAAIQNDAACIILTNNIVPPSNIISEAAHANVPLLLVPGDTFQIAMQLDHLDPLLTSNDTGRIELLEKMIRDNIDLGAITG